MQDRNPYAAPQTNVARPDGVEEYGEIKIFSASGRIGRVRYIGYTMGLTILIGILVSIAAGLVGAVSPDGAFAVLAAGYLAIIVVQILLTIQRSHDMNTTGWLSVLWLVPLVNLLFWFVPGTVGENNYGKQPPPNTVGAIVVACIIPFISIFGILAAIAIPAYQDYTIRAQVSEGLNLAVAPKAAVAETFERGGGAPVDRLAAGLSADPTESGGKYVEGVTIVVTYGSAANGVIAGRTLAIQPYVMPDRAIVWRCAYGPVPIGAAMDAGAPTSDGATDVEPRHLPSACRP
jgi:uncharacterized membrane protein YhaH (DUF805 family)/Tfp pilus assembly major pilin PilA